jgi:hypothetical protein
LPRGAPAPPGVSKDKKNWAPFGDRIAYELGQFLFKKNQTSQSEIDSLMEIWAASLLQATKGDTEAAQPPFTNHKDLHAIIDSIPLGNVCWESFTASYDGEKPENAPSWMGAGYEVFYRNPRHVVEQLLKNPDFKDEFDYAPRRDTKDGKRCFKDFMSGNWVWDQAVSN